MPSLQLISLMGSNLPQIRCCRYCKHFQSGHPCFQLRLPSIRTPLFPATPPLNQDTLVSSYASPQSGHPCFQPPLPSIRTPLFPATHHLNQDTLVSPQSGHPCFQQRITSIRTPLFPATLPSIRTPLFPAAHPLNQDTFVSSHPPLNQDTFVSSHPSPQSGHLCFQPPLPSIRTPRRQDTSINKPHK